MCVGRKRECYGNNLKGVVILNKTETVGNEKKR